MGWQTIGQYQYQFDSTGYTGWYRCVGGKMANGIWPQWNNEFSKTFRG